MNQPLISVIIPVYGADKYLDEAIQSVRNQTLTDIEIVCVNDCSPDNSQAILEKHAQEDNRIKIINHTENLHEGGARNTGIKNASADWLYFMDNDDLLYENCCEELYKPTTNHDDIDLVICDSYNTVDTILGTFYTGGLIPPTVQKLDGTSITLQDLNYQIEGFLPIPPWSKLHKKSFMLEHNISFPEHITCSDWSVALLEYGYADKIFVVNKPLYKYKLLRKGSQTANFGEFDPFKSSFESKITILLEDPNVDNKIKSAVLVSVIRFFHHYFYNSDTNNLTKNLPYVSNILQQYQSILLLDNIKNAQVIQAFQEGDLQKIQSFKQYKVSRILNRFRFLWTWVYIIKYYLKKFRT